MLVTFIALSLCCAAFAMGMALRHEIGLALDSSFKGQASLPALPENQWFLLTATAAHLLGSFTLIWVLFEVPLAGALSVCVAITLCGLIWHTGQNGRTLFQNQELKEMRWIVRQRGSVQDQIMRACEREAMERRLRRCQSTLMLTRRGGNDLTLLFNTLEEQVASMEHRAMDAADVIGGFAAHLRHVFMESDCDDIPLGEACRHITRWAQVLEKLGASAISISGEPDADSPLAQRRIPALLMLGATERLGVAALQDPTAAPMYWQWSIDGHVVRLETTGGGPLQLGGNEYRDWDAAFMLRHGGIAHAGGAWAFELPLLSGPESGLQAANEPLQ